MKQITEACGCCEGIEIVTPQPTSNRLGLTELSYRIGTHATFLETMLARLSSSDYPKLAELRTREISDPAIALLDAWAVVADVLTFYNERIINEGYLRTATERRSILELARLVGYKLRSGVASSVYLAYTLDANTKNDVLIPKGARSQSIPDSGDLPQSFETSEDLKARAKWNNLRPRLTQPQTKESIKPISNNNVRIYLKGVSTNLKPNDPLLIDFNDGEIPTFDRVKEVKTEPNANRTLVILQSTETVTSQKENNNIGLIDDLNKPPSVQPANSLRFGRNLKAQFVGNVIATQQSNSASINADSSTLFHETTGTQAAAIKPTPSELLRTTLASGEASHSALKTFAPALHETFATAATNAKVTLENVIRVYALRVKAAPFGHNAPLEPIKNRDNLVIGFKEWDLKKSTGVTTENFEIVTQIVPSGDIINVAGKIQQINLNVTTQETGLDISAVVTIDSNVLEISKRSLKSEPPFDIDFPAANDVITVSTTVLSDIENIHTQIMRVYTFRNRLLEIKLIYDSDRQTGKFTVTVSSDGSDPTTIIAPSLNIRGSASALLETTVKGTRQIPSLSQTTEKSNEVSLDAPYGQIIPNSWIVLERPNAVGIIKQIVISQVERASERSRADYGITAKGTHITLNKDWLDLDKDTFAVIRGTTIHAQSEELELAEEPITENICGGSEQLIELDDYYESLEAGRWVIVSGEREIEGTSGVRFSELAMLASVSQDTRNIGVAEERKGNKLHTFIKLANKLEYCFKRETLAIYGNVVKATHGETRNEVLGSGNGAKALQSFTLKQPPLTYIPASNPSGVDSTLNVYVNDVKWHETDTLVGLTSTSRNFITKTDDENKTTLIFGNGREGLRLPTGIENIKTEYRNGIGKQGNVKSEQISLLATKPLGVKAVINPLRASGGADRENRDQARKNVPLALKALDRLVSVQDYEDFTRIFAGIGKARATELSDGRRQIVHLTIAGADDIPIDKSADLYRNLYQALLNNGDPFQAIQVEVRELMLIVIEARIRIQPDYLWESVVTTVRTALLDAFSFERRELGQDVLLSEILSVMQAVRGVAYVDVNMLRGIPEKILDEETKKRKLITPADIVKLFSNSIEDANKAVIKEPFSCLPVNLAAYEKDVLHPAQLAFLTPEVPATLNLIQII